MPASNADLDFSQRTVRKEVYDPDGSVVRSETRSGETTAGAASLAGGEPDANFRGDGFTGTRTTQDSTRETRTTNFEINKQEENIITPVGELKRLTVAVIVDGTWETNAETGESTYIPRSAEEIARIKTLISNAVGFDDMRGDTIEVSNISFGEPELYDSDSPHANHAGIRPAVGQTVPQRSVDLPLPHPGRPARGHGLDPAPRRRTGN